MDGLRLMNFAIYLHSAAAPSIDSGEDFLVPATNELERYLGPTAKATLVPARDLAPLASKSAGAALSRLEEPAVVLVVRRD